VLRFLERALGLLRFLLRWYLILLMSALVVLTFVQVLARYLMDSPFTSTPQLVRIVVVWLTFMGAAVAILQGKNVRIDTVEQLLPAKIRDFLGVFFDLVLIALLVIITVKGYTVYVVGGFQVIIDTPFSYQVMYSSLVVGAGLMALFVLVRLLFKLGVVGQAWIGGWD